MALPTELRDDVLALRAAAVTFRTSLDRIGLDLGGVYQKVLDAAAAKGAARSGPFLCGYPDEGFDPRDFTCVAGVPVDKEIDRTGEVDMVEFAGGRAAIATHVGTYDGLAAAWPELWEWIGGRALQVRAMPYEVYRLDVEEAESPEQAETDLVVPVL